MRHLHRVPYATVALAIAPVNLKRIASGPEGALLGKRPVASPQSFRERVCVREREIEGAPQCVGQHILLDVHGAVLALVVQQ